MTLYNEVAMACVQIPKPPTPPAIESKITRDITAAASRLHCLLENPDLPPNHLFRVFRYGERRNEFIKHLERIARLTYRRPPPNIDQAKRACANLAYLLITKCTTRKPTGTENGLFRDCSKPAPHQHACPTEDGEFVDLKTRCDEVLRRVKAGGNIENDSW